MGSSHLQNGERPPSSSPMPPWQWSRQVARKSECQTVRAAVSGLRSSVD
jgi:hypothetical protein